MASLGDLMVKIGADVAELNSGLGEASGKITEFANHSLEALAGVAESLAFEKLGESLLKAGEDFEKAGFTFQKTAGATGAALEGLEENFASLYLKSSQSSENLASALAQLSIRTGATGEDLENLASSFGKLTKVVGGDLNANITESERLFKQWGIDIEDQKGKLDALVVITQKTGISYGTLAEQLTAFGPILRNMGFDFDQSAALLGKFDSSGLGTQQIMRALGQGLSELGQKFADPEQALRLLIERMAAAPSTTVALQIALSEGLGKKGALALADAVHQGVFAIDDLVKAAQNSGGTIDDIASKTQTLSGQWTKFQHALEEALVPLGKDLINALSAALDALKPLAGLLGDSIKWFEGLPAPIKYTAEALAAIVGVTPAVILGIKGVTVAAEALGFTEALAGIKNVAFALTNNLVPALTTGETMLLRLGQAGILAATAFAGWELGKWLRENIPLMKEFGDSIADWILKVPGMQALIDHFSGIKSAQADMAVSTAMLADRLAKLGIEIDVGPNASIEQYNKAVMDAAKAAGIFGGSVAGTHAPLSQHADDAQKAKSAIEVLHAQYTSGQITLDQYNAKLQALTASLAPSAAAMAKAAKEAADWNDKWAESARRAMDVVAEVGSGDAGPEQAFSKLNSVIETGSINFDKLSAAGVKTYLSLVASLNDMRKAMVDAQNNEALDKITEQLGNLQVKASELADTVPKDFRDMMNGVTEGVNFTGLEKQLQSTIDGLANAAKTASPEFKGLLQTVIDKSQDALNGLRSMTGALALIGQDRSMETLGVQIKGLIDQQNKGALSGEQWQAGLNGVSDALLKKIIPAMQQGVPISQALVDQLAKIPGIGAQLAAAASQGFDAFNNAVIKWSETTRASVLSVNDAFKNLGVTSLDASSQAMTRSGNDIIAVLKNISDSTGLTTAQFTADQAAVIAWGEKVLPPMAKFGQSVSSDVLAQVAKISPALAQAAKDGPDAFAAALDALKTKAVTSTMTLADAFHDLGVKSGRELNNAADIASAAYDKIAASGTASANTQRDALIKALEAEKAAYIAAGADLPKEQQKELDHLLAQQDAFNRAHEDQWMKLYKDIQGIVDGFFHDLAATTIKDVLFGGADNSALKTQIADLKSQLSDATAAYLKSQADIQAQMKQAVIDNKAALASQLADLRSQLDQKTKAYADYVANYKAQLADLEQASAQNTAKQVQALKDSLAQEKQDYSKFKSDTIDQMADLTKASKQQLDAQLSDLNDQLASQTESYNEFVNDTTTSIARIGEAFQDAVSDKGTDTGRNIADKQTDLTRAQQDTATEIQRLRDQETAANKESTEQQIADLQTSLQRKTEDTNTYISRAEQDLETFTKEHKQQADEQTADLKTALDRRTSDYKDFVSKNKQQQADDTANAKFELAKQEAQLIGSLVQRQAQLAYDTAQTKLKIATVTQANADELVKQEAALKAGLDAQTADYNKYKAGIAAQMTAATADAAKALAKQESDLQASLDKQTADYQTYVDGVNGYTDKNGKYHKGQLDTLKDQFKSVWTDIGTLVQNAAGKMLTDMVTSFFKPMTDKIASLIAGSIADLLGKTGLGGISDALTGIGKQMTSVFTPQGTGTIGDPTGGAGGGDGGAAGAAAGAIGSGLTGILGAAGSIATAISSIIGNFQMAHIESSLNAIERENARMAIYLGDQAGNSIQFYTGKTVEWLGYATKDLDSIGVMMGTLSDPWKPGGSALVYLKGTNDNTFWSEKKLEDINNKIGKTTTSATDTAQLGALDWMKTALGNINTTLQFNVGLSPWFQTAFQNMNNGIVACAGWLQGISNMFSSGAAKVGGGSAGTVSLAGDAFGSLASFVNSQFSTLYTWLGAAFKPLLTVFGGQGLTVAPGMPAIPSFSGGSSSGGSASAPTIDFTSLQTFLGGQFTTLLTSTNSIGLKVQNLTDINSLKLDQLIAVTKLTIQIPASVTASPLALAGAAANIVSSSSNTQNNAPVNITINNPTILNAKHATDLVNMAVQETRRRGRAIG